MINHKMNTHSIETEYFQIVRSYAIRYISHMKQKSSPQPQIDEMEIVMARILNQSDLKQTILTKLMNLQIKGDYLQVIALTMLQDLSKWSKDNHQYLSEKQQQLLETIVERTISLLNSQQQFHTIVPKQNDLLRDLLLMPHVVDNIQHYRVFYRKLKDVKEFYPSMIKENQKIQFLRTIEQSIETICLKKQLKSVKTLEFIFSNIFSQLQVIEQTHEFVTSRLKLIRKIVKSIWYFNQEIMYKSVFLISKFSQHVLSLPHLLNSTLNLYEDLMPRLVEKLSAAPLIIYNHLIVSNIKRLLEKTGKPNGVFTLQILLNSLSNIFREPFVFYFMKNYDANFMQESAGQNSLNLLYQFVQNRINQKRPEYEIFKKYLKRAIDNIRVFLSTQQQLKLDQPVQQKLLKFYEVKKKQYLQIAQDMNEKPKKLFKKLQSISNKDVKQQIMKKYVRIAKRSVHVENKAMIDIFATNNTTSEDMFAQYIHYLFGNLGKDVNLQQFIRYFSSNFFLNGQSQQILRVLDKITVLYYQHQPSSARILKSSDSTYTFANAIILLNTDLHNPQNEQKMSVESFYKMCKRINQGEDLPLQLLNKTYTNVKRNKINTFRNKSNMVGISPYNMVLLCNKEDQAKVQFYDLEMRMLNDNNFYHSYVYDLLVGIIDERDTNKLETLIERFTYDQNAFQCQIIQLVRKLAKKKHRVPLYALEKILQHANFKNNKTSETLLSYLWLATNLIQNFHSYIPTNVICEVLILTWRTRHQIKDNMYLREKAQIKRTKRLINQKNKKTTKKSIMDMFSNFLMSSAKNSSDDETSQNSEEFTLVSNSCKKLNYKGLTERILQVLLGATSHSNHNICSSKINHRGKAIQFFIGYLRNDEQKIFQEFLSLLYLIFHLLYHYIPIGSQEQIASIQPVIEQKQTKQKTDVIISPSKLSLSKSLQLSTTQKNQNIYYQQNVQDLLYQLLGLKESSITKRIENLKLKDTKKYMILQHYSYFWVLKVLIARMGQNKTNQKIHSAQQIKSNHKIQNNLDYLLNKSVSFLVHTDKDSYLDLVSQFQSKVKKIFNVHSAINQRLQKQLSSSKESFQLQANDNSNKQNTSNTQEQVETTNQDGKIINQDELSKDIPESVKIQKKSSFSQCSSTLIEEFIKRYQKIIIQFYKQGQRILGQQLTKNNKQWKWLFVMYKMATQLVNQTIQNQNLQVNHQNQPELAQNKPKSDPDKQFKIQQKIQVTEYEKAKLQPQTSKQVKTDIKLQQKHVKPEQMNIQTKKQGQKQSKQNQQTTAKNQNIQKSKIQKENYPNQVDTQQQTQIINKQKTQIPNEQSKTIQTDTNQKTQQQKIPKFRQIKVQNQDEQLQQWEGNEDQIMGMPVYLL